MESDDHHHRQTRLVVRVAIRASGGMSVLLMPWACLAAFLFKTPLFVFDGAGRSNDFLI